MDEKEFQDAYGLWAAIRNMNPNPDDPAHQYDYRAALSSGVIPPMLLGQHWPSQFKMKNHPNRFVNGIDTISGKATNNEISLYDLIRNYMIEKHNVPAQ